jgi:hypothetical protein
MSSETFRAIDVRSFFDRCFMRAFFSLAEPVNREELSKVYQRTGEKS